MDCPINAVKARMFHARNKLRALVPVLAIPE
jgi:DNA-directed RNA polymerase specialized sigma24 family protein